MKVVQEGTKGAGGLHVNLRGCGHDMREVIFLSILLLLIVNNFRHKNRVVFACRRDTSQ